MELKRGIPVSPGVAIGPALVLDAEGFRIPEQVVGNDLLEGEVVRFERAIAEATREAEESQATITAKLGKQYGAIFGAHAAVLQDPVFLREVKQLIRQHGNSAEYAISRVIRRHIKAWQSLERGDFASRASDLFDIEKLLLRHLLGEKREQLQQLKKPVVVLAQDLTPSETATLDPKMVLGCVTEAGGRASHTALLLGQLGIPAVVGVGTLLTDVSGGDEVIVDGTRGNIILKPDAETRVRYEQTRQSFQAFETELGQLRDLPAMTIDNVRAHLYGNIEFPQEATQCVERGAEGVGLYRTEFLYLDKQTDPTETEHLEAYLTVLRLLGPRPVVIRTLDLGADKFLHIADPNRHERNPFLGLRSVRLCLRNLPLFKTQMRAILRASAFGDVRIMFPMVSTLLELRQCKMILAEVKEDLEEERIPFNRNIPVGTMIEVPSAALLSHQMAKEVDFFSIGTNDLVQYTLAADRTNEAVASLYNPADPAVLRLIELVLSAAEQHNVEVSICGEMSGEPIYTMLLLGMGLRRLSVTPHNIPEIKKVIRSITIEEAKEVAREAMQFETARDVTNYLREQTRRILPEVIN